MVGVQRRTYLNVNLTFVYDLLLMLQTKASTIRCKLILFEDNLITVGLKRYWRIWRFCKDEICGLGVTLARLSILYQHHQ